MVYNSFIYCLILFANILLRKPVYIYIWFTMLCQSLIYSKVTQLYIYILFHYNLSQYTEYSSLYYTLRPHCLSILNLIIFTYQPALPSISLSLPPPAYNHKSLCLWVCFCFAVAQLLSYVSLFAIPWTEAHQPALSCTISLSLLKLMSV